MKQAASPPSGPDSAAFRSLTRGEPLPESARTLVLSINSLGGHLWIDQIKCHRTLIDWLRMVNPSPGKTIQGLVTPYLCALVEARNELARRLSSGGTTAEMARAWGAPDSLPSLQAPRWIAEAVLSTWLLHRSTTGTNAGLREAVQWFGASGLCTTEIPDCPTGLPVALPSGADLASLLPYVLEAFSDHLADVDGRASARELRRASGTYYTPTDVAEFAVSGALDRLPAPKVEQATVLDPAVGTGVFLRVAALMISERTGRTLGEIVADQLHGIDINPASARSAAFVLTELALRDTEARPWEVWNALRSKMRVGDSTTLTPAGVDQGLDRIHPEPDSGFDLVVGNPPFSRLTRDAQSALRARLFESMRGRSVETPAYLPFVEMCWMHAKQTDSAAALVLPLSVVANRDASHQLLRSAMSEVRADWDFLSFDRTPDSLFGDDVKTRNVILFMRRARASTASPVIRTTGLLRWSIAHRQSILSHDNVMPVEVDGSIRAFVPKFSSALERDAYASLRGKAPLGSALATGNTRESVVASATAYNWLPLTRFRGQLDRGTRAGTVLPFMDRDMADCAYAILMSRLTYWLWRVAGDGFHLTSSFLRDLPVSPAIFSDDVQAALAAHGRRLWESVQARPVRSINAGTESLSFSPEGSSDLLDQIDTTLCPALGLPSGFAAYLRTFQTETVEAGRTKPRGGHIDHAESQSDAEGSEPPLKGRMARVHENGLVHSQR